MTTYTAIPDANLDPDSPARSVDALSLRDNATAIAENDTSIPDALCSTGAVLVWDRQAALSFSNSAYLAGNVRDDPAASVGVRVFASGTITASFKHWVDTSGTSFSRILKNGGLVQEWSTTSLTQVARTVDVTVAVGDVVLFQSYYTGGTNGNWINLTLQADRYIRLNSSLGV